MKIIQTFWSGNHKDNITSNKYGWFSEEYHLMSWALSCLQLKKHYPNVELYTDEPGYNILIKKLKLPYTKVHQELESLNFYHNDLWALSKIYAYSKQKESFLHVDGDVYIWEPFDQKLMEKPLIAQNLEFGSKDYYEKMFSDIKKNLDFIPEEMMKVLEKEKSIWAYNAGIFGGSDINFFQKYTTQAFKFVKKNLQKLEYIDKNSFNVFFEQYLFYCISKIEEKEVNVLFNDLIQDNGYRNLGDFEDVPFDKKYLHLLGPFKKDYKTCELMARRLREDFPEYYYRILKLYPEKYRNTLSINYNILSDKFSNHNKKNNENFLLNNHFYRTHFFLKIILNYDPINIENLSDILTIVKKTNNIHLLDLFSYEKLIYEKLKPNNVSSLLNRDLRSNTYFKTIFSEEFEPKMVKSQLIHIGISNWNWQIEDKKLDYFRSRIKFNREIKKSRNVNLIIPEIEFPFYSEVLIDELDELILEILDLPKTRNTVLNEVKKNFAENDLDFSNKELELLINNRLKNLIFYKCIEVNPNNKKQNPVLEHSNSSIQ